MTLKTKYKKVVPVEQQKPKQYEIISDGNILEELSDLSFRYIKSRTKLGDVLNFSTQEQKQKFLQTCKTL